MMKKNEKSFFDAFRLLLPRSRAFDLTIDKVLRRLFLALSAVMGVMKGDFEGVLLDYYPETTRNVDEWHRTFKISLSSVLFSKEERQKALSVIWRLQFANATGECLQDALQCFAPDLIVTENTPFANVPGLVFAYRSVCGAKKMVCGEKHCFCEWQVGNRKYMPQILQNGKVQKWNVPYLRQYYEMCFFISRSVFRDAQNRFIVIQRLKLQEKWREFFEFVISAVKPVHMTAVLFVEWVSNDAVIEYTD